MDKLYFRSLTDKNVKIDRKDLKIKVDIDKENRIISYQNNIITQLSNNFLYYNLIVGE